MSETLSNQLHKYDTTMSAFDATNNNMFTASAAITPEKLERQRTLPAAN